MPVRDARFKARRRVRHPPPQACRCAAPVEACRSAWRAHRVCRLRRRLQLRARLRKRRRLRGGLAARRLCERFGTRQRRTQLLVGAARALQLAGGRVCGRGRRR
eukprot:27421-Chlamydomonas_euryale.AAC.1